MGSDRRLHKRSPGRQHFLGHVASAQRIPKQTRRFSCQATCITAASLGTVEMLHKLRKKTVPHEQVVLRGLDRIFPGALSSRIVMEELGTAVIMGCPAFQFSGCLHLSLFQVCQDFGHHFVKGQRYMHQPHHDRQR
jgi:hypothetical protein